MTNFTTICYKTKEPIYYNKGTKYETKKDTYLFRYSNRTIEETQKEVDELNRNHPTTDRYGEIIDWNEIEYMFVDEQPIFE